MTDEEQSSTKKFRGYYYGEGDGWISPQCRGGAASMPHKCPGEFDEGGASGGTAHCNCRCHYLQSRSGA